MSTFNAFYIRKQGADNVIKSAIAGLYPKAGIQMLPEFFGAIVSRDDIEPPEQKLLELSANLGTDVIWITFQTTAESFIFHHWRAGEQLRALWYGCANEGTWERVDGAVEPWERAAFWDEETDEILQKGAVEPAVSSEDSAHAAMEYYGLFVDEESESEEPSGPPPWRTTPKQRYGCWLFFLLIVALFVFTIFGIVKLFR